MSDDRKWWDLGLNTITGLRPDPQEEPKVAAKRYYKPEENFSNKTAE